MCRKLITLISVVCLLALAGVASAAEEEHTWFGNAFGGDGASWNDPCNWTIDWANPAGVPDHNETARIVATWWLSGNPTIYASATVSDVFIGLDTSHDPNAAPPVLTIAAGGSLSTTGDDGFNDGVIVGFYSDATLVSAGTVELNDGELTLSAGDAGNGYGDALVEITGGTFDAKNVFFQNADTTAKKELYIDDGTFDVNNVVALEVANCLMDISSAANGTLILDPNETLPFPSGVGNDRIGWWVSMNHLLADGGWGVIVCDYDVTNPGRTTVTASAGNEPSQLIAWDDGNTKDSLWDSRENWGNSWAHGVYMERVPRSIDNVDILTTVENGPVIEAGMIADCNKLMVGYGSGSYVANLTMTGGELNTGPTDAYIGHGGATGGDAGLLTISGGTINVEGGAALIVGTGNGIGDINMTGGAINVNGHLSVASGAGDTGTINLDGGVITVGSLEVGKWTDPGGGDQIPNDDNGIIDITKGILVVNGDIRWHLQYLWPNNITAYGGDGALVVYYFIDTGQTWIMATPCPEGDMDWDCDVDFFDFAKMAANWLDVNNPNP